jgi:hypothetical protein
VTCTADDVRRLALALPEVYEDTHRGKPTFRVNRKIIAMLHAPKPGAPTEGFFAPLSGTRPVVGLKLDREDQLNSVAAYPQIVGEAASYGHHGWTHIWLDAVEPDLLETLIRLAWTNVAPKRLSRLSRPA